MEKYLARVPIQFGKRDQVDSDGKPVLRNGQPVRVTNWIMPGDEINISTWKEAAVIRMLREGDIERIYVSDEKLAQRVSDLEAEVAAIKKQIGAKNAGNARQQPDSDRSAVGAGTGNAGEKK